MRECSTPSLIGDGPGSRMLTFSHRPWMGPCFLSSLPQLFHPLFIHSEATWAKAEVAGLERGCRSEVEARGGEGGSGKRRGWQRGEISQPVEPSLHSCPQSLDPLTHLFSPLGSCSLSSHERSYVCIFSVISFHSVKVSSGLGEISRPGHCCSLDLD